MPYRPIRDSGRVRVQGVIYLIHFPAPYKHAKHYTGWALASGLAHRLSEHVSGQGSPLVYAACKANGITTTAQLQACVSATWPGDRYRERRFKNRGGAAKFCPTCKGGRCESIGRQADNETGTEINHRVA